MESSMGVTFPNESAEYRAARNKLLERDAALRREMEAVVAKIRALPPGGPAPEDYEFDHIDAKGASAKVRCRNCSGRAPIRFSSTITCSLGTVAISGRAERWADSAAA